MSGFNTTCALCGKTYGRHSAVGQKCPYGRPGRAQTYQYHEAQTFVPKLPKLPKDIAKIVTEFREAARDGKEFIKREYALYKLLQDLSEDRKSLARVREALQEGSPDIRKFTL